MAETTTDMDGKPIARGDTVQIFMPDHAGINEMFAEVVEADNYLTVKGENRHLTGKHEYGVPSMFVRKVEGGTGEDTLDLEK